MKKNKNIWSSLVLSIGSILLISSIDAISQNVLCAIFYGAAIVLILIALLNSKNIRKRTNSKIKMIIQTIFLRILSDLYNLQFQTRGSQFFLLTSGFLLFEILQNDYQ